MNRNFIEAWAYFVELLCCCLIVVASLMIWGLEKIAKFINTSSSEIASYFSVVMFAGAIAFFWAFYSKSDTPFANWLYKKGAYKVYVRAYLWAIGVYALLSCALSLAKTLKNDYLAVLSYWLLILGVINLYTFIKNISGQLSLNMEFNRINGERHNK